MNLLAGIVTGQGLKASAGNLDTLKEQYMLLN